MAGLPHGLTTELRATLLEGDELYNFTLLRAIFATEKLRPFRNRLKQANSGQAQADLLISDLVESHLNTGENALVLFIRELAIRYKAQQLETDLLSLAERVERVLGRDGDRAGSTDNAANIPGRQPHPDYSADELSQLRRVLISLYDDEASARRIAHDAGIPTHRIRFGASADNWFQLIQEANKHQRI